MFTIDLLKGQGIPIRSRPEGVAVAAVTLTVPVIVAIVMLGYYLRTSIVMAIERQDIVNYQTKIEELTDNVGLQESFEQEKGILNNCLLEVSSSIGRHSQWSPVVAAVVSKMPASVLMTRLELKQRYVIRKVASKDNPQQMVDVTVPVKTLQMNICGDSPANCDKAVRDFRDTLRASPLLQSKLENIRVSQKSDKLSDQDVVSYEISCNFK